VLGCPRTVPFMKTPPADCCRCCCSAFRCCAAATAATGRKPQHAPKLGTWAAGIHAALLRASAQSIAAAADPKCCPWPRGSPHRAAAGRHIVGSPGGGGGSGGGAHRDVGPVGAAGKPRVVLLIADGGLQQGAGRGCERRDSPYPWQNLAAATGPRAHLCREGPGARSLHTLHQVGG
jgi:hypothetical protein